MSTARKEGDILAALYDRFIAEARVGNFTSAATTQSVLTDGLEEYGYPLLAADFATYPPPRDQALWRRLRRVIDGLQLGVRPPEFIEHLHDTATRNGRLAAVSKPSSEAYAQASSSSS